MHKDVETTIDLRFPKLEPNNQILSIEVELRKSSLSVSNSL